MGKTEISKEIDIETLKKSVMNSLTKIRNYRNKINWTIADLSKSADVSVGIISELENEKKQDKKVPSLVNFIALARALRLPEEYIIELVLGIKTSNISHNKRDDVINALKDYGIRDEQTIRVIMHLVNFLKKGKI